MSVYPKRLFFSLKRAALPDIWHHPPFKKKYIFFLSLSSVLKKKVSGVFLSGIQTVDFWVVLPPVGQSQSRPFERSDLRSRSSGVLFGFSLGFFGISKARSVHK